MDITAPTNQPTEKAEKIAEKIDVVVNKRSGTVLRLGEDTVRQGLVESLGARLGDIRFIEGKDIIPSVKTWTETYAGAKRGLIVGGGDGTVLTAASLFMGRQDITMGVLPLGTHNLFARQLGFSADFRDAAKQYKKVESTRVDVGNVNGENFLVGLMIDQNSVDFYRARELWRDKKVFRAAGKFLSTLFGIVAGRKAKLSIGGALHQGRLFLVTNNQFQPRSNAGTLPKPTAEGLKPVIENILAKGDADGLLGFYAFKGGPHNLAAIVPKMWDGTWTQAKSVKVVTAPELVIQPDSSPNWLQKLLRRTPKPQTTLPVILDGEPKEAQYPLNVKILAQSLPVYKPAP